VGELALWLGVQYTPAPPSSSIEVDEQACRAAESNPRGRTWPLARMVSEIAGFGHRDFVHLTSSLFHRTHMGSTHFTFSSLNDTSSQATIKPRTLLTTHERP